VHLDCAGRRLDLSEPAVMGVLNVTPDSFSDGGSYPDVDGAVARSREMEAEGAAIVDIGGESTRPGAEPVTEAVELDRVVPAIEACRRALSIPVSVDTSKPGVMRAAVDAGAGLINDVRALREPGALDAAAACSVPVLLMHMQGEPATMQQAPGYGDVVAEIRDFLAERIAACTGAGIEANRLMVDPGFGFGKTLEHNLELLARLDELLTLGAPLAVGMSRKSMIGAVTGRAATERACGSAAAAALAVARGASLVRAHDVGATVDAVRVAAAVRGFRR